MANPTVNSLAQVMMRESGEDTSNSALLGQYEAWVQDVYDEIGIQAEWSYLWTVGNFNTVVGTRVYDLTAQFSPELLDQGIVIKRLSDNKFLLNKRRQELMVRDIDFNLAGDPDYWYIEPGAGNSTLIGLYRVPASIISMEIFGLLQPTELQSTDVLPFPRSFIFLLKDGMRIKMKEDDKDYAGADRVRARFNDGLRKLKQNSDTQIANVPRMDVMDISSGRDNLVRLDPNHFRN
jgi:hypothetical protein